MVRLACISLSKLRLQLLLRKHPDWEGLPVAVIQEERPTSPIIQFNKLAEKDGVQIGFSYAAGLAIAPDLRAHSIGDDEVDAALTEVIDVLKNFSPEIEPCRFDPEAIWINATGMTALFDSFENWHESLRNSLQERGLWARVVVGFSRFGTYALSKAGRHSRVFETLEEEHSAISASPITVFPLSLRSYRTLMRLGIKTLGDFLRLPEDGAKRRFGQDTQVLVDVLKLDRKLPIQAMHIQETRVYRRGLDSPLFSIPLLMEEIQPLVEGIMRQASAEVQLIESIELQLRDENGETGSEILRPSHPTQDGSIFLRLVDLRLSERKFRAGIEEISIFPTVAHVSREQHDLFGPVGRDTALASEAFAVIRARFGNKSVCTAVLQDSHVPEKSFSWEALEKLPAAATIVNPVPNPHDTTTAAASDSLTPPIFAAIRRLLLLRRQSAVRPNRSSLLCTPFVVSEGWYGVSNGELRLVPVDPKETVFEQQVVSDFPAIENLHREYDFHISEDVEILWAYMDRLTMAYQVQGFVD